MFLIRRRVLVVALVTGSLSERAALDPGVELGVARLEECRQGRFFGELAGHRVHFGEALDLRKNRENGSIGSRTRFNRIYLAMMMSHETREEEENPEDDLGRGPRFAEKGLERGRAGRQGRGAHRLGIRRVDPPLAAVGRREDRSTRNFVRSTNSIHSGDSRSTE